MSVDDPRADFEDFDPWLQIVLGLASFARTLDLRLPAPRTPHRAADDDPGVDLVLGLVALRRRLAAEIPAPARDYAPAPAPAAAAPIPSILR